MGSLAEIGRGRWVFGAAAALVVAASLAFAAIVQYQPLGGAATTAIDDIGEAVAAFIAAAACAYAARRAIANDRVGWTLMTISAIAGVDLALWDLLGKSLDAPVWRLLGGRRAELLSRRSARQRSAARTVSAFRMRS